MKVKKGQELAVETTDVAFGGKGLAKVDGMVVFIEGAVPGDAVRCRVVKKKQRFAEARVVEVIRPSVDRVDPPCPYVGFCGGCKWQHLVYERQLEYKRRHVLESLEHIGGIKGTTVHPTVPSESVFGYRNKMEFSCADRRWVLPEELGVSDIPSDFALGLHVPGTFHKVIDIDACLLQPAAGNRILTDVRHLMKSSGLPPYGLKSHVGFWRFLVLRHSVASDRWMVNLVTSAENAPVMDRVSKELTALHPEIVAVVNNVTAGKAAIAVGETERHLAGQRTLQERIGRFVFDISANSFFQTNTRGAEKLYAVVSRYAELSGNEQVVDLYCGAGAISIYLSDFAQRITGIEIVESAIADAEANSRKNNVSNCRFLLGDAVDALPKLSFRPDVVIVDPPRAGMHKKAVAQLRDMAPDRLVYVSCNPATMARDLAMMQDRYRLLEVQPVDMFPHTYHIEAVCKLQKIGG